MIGNLKRQMVETNYRLKIRSTLQKATIEEIKITKEECIREIERRNKKNGK